MLNDLLYHYKVKVVRVVDGDTFHGDIDLGFHLRKREVFRLAGIDTPETWRSPTQAENAHGQQATDFVKDLIDGKEVIVRSMADGLYGRFIVRVYLTKEDYENDRSLSEILIENGFEKRDSYIDEE